ncbi:MAG: sporulation protein YqfD [Clostridia bacterium]|nr:sporulation protein YqfD [Clostridia bacterium]
MGTTRFEVVGLNQLKLLNVFLAEAITISDLHRQSQRLMRFTVKNSDKAKVIDIMDRQCFEYCILAETGIKKSLFGLARRCGVFIGIVAVIVLAVFAERYLWKIEISGNDRIDDLTITRALEESGISVGSKKNFDSSLVEETIMALSDVSAVSAQIVGTTLKIEVLENAVTTQKEASGEVISLYDAEVVRIIIKSGTPTVNIGDRVPMGATLIEGIEYNTEGLPMLEVEAKGQIFGKVNFTYSETVSQFYTARTGNSQSNTVIKIFGLNIGKPPENLYEKYEVERTLTQIGSFIPLYAETTRYYELNTYEVSLDKLLESVRDKAVNNLVICAGGSPITTTMSYKTVAEGVYRITVHIEAEVSIGGKKIDRICAN